MSLYTMSEICEGCMYGNWHVCCGTFCCCDFGIKDAADENIDHMEGTCKKKGPEEDK